MISFAVMIFFSFIALKLFCQRKTAILYKYSFCYFLIPTFIIKNLQIYSTNLLLYTSEYEYLI